MSEHFRTLWAPWRMNYIREIVHHPDPNACFLCHYWEQRDNDRRNFVVWRGTYCFAAFNQFPYNNGHLLVAPGAHLASLVDLEQDVLTEMFGMVRDAQRLMTEVLRPGGFNIGINEGHCAGAGLPDHVHVHVVPRWDGDTNFMGVVGGTRVIPQDMDELYEEMVAAAPRLGFAPMPQYP